MQPTNNNSDTPAQTSNDASTESYRDSETSKSSIYRAMVARTDSAVWRGNARSKLAAGIEEGATEQATSSLGLEDIDTNQQDLALGETADEQDVIQEYMEEVACDDNAPLEDPVSNEPEKANLSDEQETQVMETGLVDKPEEVQIDKKEEEEPEIPIIYKNWEPKPEDDEATMEDIELGVESELEDHIGELECELDNGAFDRLRKLEEEKVERERKHRNTMAASAVLILALLTLTSWLIAALIHNSHNKSNNTNQEPTHQTINVFNDGRQVDSGSLSWEDQASASTPKYTGHLTALEEPEISKGSNTYNDRITVKFPVNMLIPEGSSVLHKVYDGPDCSGGSKDITGMDDYVEAGVYSAGPARSTNNPAERMGVYLQWDPEKLQDSPLYTQWIMADPAAADTSTFNPEATMDLCVSLFILNSEGLPDHYMETYIFTTWTEDNLLEKVHTLPITTDST